MCDYVHMCSWTCAFACTGHHLRWPEPVETRWALREVKLCVSVSLLGTGEGPHRAVLGCS